jgi:hypothetical protein
MPRESILDEIKAGNDYSIFKTLIHRLRRWPWNTFKAT